MCMYIYIHIYIFIYLNIYIYICVSPPAAQQQLFRGVLQLLQKRLIGQQSVQTTQQLYSWIQAGVRTPHSLWLVSWTLSATSLPNEAVDFWLRSLVIHFWKFLRSLVHLQICPSGEAAFWTGIGSICPPGAVAALSM